jgi:hypothetical protein
MFGSLMLDVAIGMALVYLLLSFVAAAVREGIESLLKERSTFLRRGISELLRDESLTTDLFNHPQVSALYRGTYEQAKASKQLPSYIPARNFALALMDIAVRGRDASSQIESGPGSAPLSVAAIRQNVTRIGNPGVQRVVLSAIDLSGGNFERAQKAIESWFDSAMDRVSGWYKHRTQRILIVTGVIVAIVANVDTIRIAHKLYNDPGQRQLAVAMAGSIVSEPQPGQGTTAASAAREGARADSLAGVMLRRLDALELPIGWPDQEFARDWYMRVIGWLITGFAISFGAPFWFDLLNKMMVIRSTVKPHEKSPEESSEDRQTGKDRPPVMIATPPQTLVAGAPAGALATAHDAGGATIDPGQDYATHEWSSGFPQAGIL